MDYQSASLKLSEVICQAICDCDPKACEYLLLDRKPSLDEITDPRPGTFISVCRFLGLNWHELKESISSAQNIASSDRPKLRLVQ